MRPIPGRRRRTQTPASLAPRPRPSPRLTPTPPAPADHPTEVLGNPAGPPTSDAPPSYGAPPPPAPGLRRPAARDGPPVYGATARAPRRAARLRGHPDVRAYDGRRPAAYGARRRPAVDSLGRPQKPPRRGPGWPALIGIAAAIALVAGLLGGVVGGQAQRRRPARPAARSRSATTPPGDLSRPGRLGGRHRRAGPADRRVDRGPLREHGRHRAPASSSPPTATSSPTTTSSPRPATTAPSPSRSTTARRRRPRSSGAP